MKLVRTISVIALFALLLPLSALAKDNNKGSFSLSSTAQVAGTLLQPGNYTVEWSGTGSTTQVKFVRNGKTVVTAPGKVVQLKNRPPYNQVVVTNNNGQNVIQEIDFGSRTTALKFGEAGEQSGQ